MSDSPSDSCAALNLINAAVFCDCALTKTGLMDSRLLSAASSGSVKRVGLTSLRRSILKDLIPQGRKQRYVRKKGKKKDKMFSLFSTARWFYRFFSPFFFFDLPTLLGNEEDQFRSAAPPLGSQPPAVPLPQLPHPFCRCCHCCFCRCSRLRSQHFPPCDPYLEFADMWTNSTISTLQL